MLLCVQSDQNLVLRSMEQRQDWRERFSLQKGTSYSTSSKFFLRETSCHYQLHKEGKNVIFGKTLEIHRTS